jgi:hypothetical protein
MKNRIFTMLQTHRRLAMLFLFLTLCFNLGYAGMVRFYPGTGMGGLGDAYFYYSMSFFVYDDVPAPFRFRLLIPSLAGLLTEGVLIDILPVLFSTPPDAHTVGIFVINSVLVSLTTLVLVELGTRFGLTLRTSLLAAFVYLTSYPVINAYLVGLVDAGEACILAALALVLIDRRWWLLPLLVGVGALVKETTVVFAGVFLLCWWLLAQRELSSTEKRRLLWWAAAAVALGIIGLVGIRALIGGEGYHAHQLSIERLLAMPAALLRIILNSRSVLYACVVLLPLGLPGIHRIPRMYRLASLATGMVALVLAIYADINGNIVRPLFNTVGPLFVLASAISLDTLLNVAPGKDKMPAA